MKIVSRKFAKATIKDVAECAGVSVTTVSHFVNGRKFACSAETAERIKEAIRTMHYAPGPSARRARDQATRTIGLCVESADDISDSYDQRRSYHERLNRAIIREADAEAYALLHYPYCVRHGDSAEAFLDGRVDGLILGAGRCDQRAHELTSAGLPTVLVNRVADVPDECGLVSIKETDTAALALDHLWELGHRRIAHLAGPVAFSVPGSHLATVQAGEEHEIFQGRMDTIPSDSANRRCDAYIKYMSARDAYDPALIGSAGSWADASTIEVDDILDLWLNLPEPPTAVFCANDSLAIAVTVAARRTGIAIPTSLSVVGVNNQAAAEEAVPPITSVDIPAEDLGREAMHLLLRMLAGGEFGRDQLRIELPVTRLVVRCSTSQVVSAGR